MGKQSRQKSGVRRGKVSSGSRPKRATLPPVKIPTDQDNRAWLDMWQRNQIDFHQTETDILHRNIHLSNHWPVSTGANLPRVLVPLCGKSLDMLWLSQQGYEVIGIELSHLAVQAFFEENGLTYQRRSEGAFECWQGDGIRVYCGDIFHMSATQLGVIDLVYDHASLTALDEAIRSRYVAHIMTLLPPDLCPIFIHTHEDTLASDEARQIDAELAGLYQNWFSIEVLAVQRTSDDAGVSHQPAVNDIKLYHLRPLANDATVLE